MYRYIGCVVRLSVVLLVFPMSRGLTQPLRVAQPQPSDATGRTEEKLCFKFKPGDKFSLVSVTKTSKTRSFSTDANQNGLAADTNSTKQTVRITSDLDIDEVEADGSAWAKYTYRQVALKIEAKDMKIDFDSSAFGETSPPAGDESRSHPDKIGTVVTPLRRPERRIEIPLLALPWVSVIGEDFYLKITPQGRVTNINGLNAVVGNAKSKIPNIPMRDQLIAATEQQFSEESIKRSLANQLAVFPDVNAGPARTGDTWSRIQATEQGTVTIDWNYRLKEIRPDGIGIVDVNVIVASDTNAGPVFVRGMKAEREFSGGGAGQIEIEPRYKSGSGCIINSETTQDMVEKIRFLPEEAFRRPPPSPAPARTHIVTTFQMFRRLPAEGGDSDQLPALSEVNQPSFPDF